MQHDASRVIQAAIQFGNEEQRKELLKEVCADSAVGLAELSKIQYAHFCCLKFIKYCGRDTQCVKTIVKVSAAIVQDHVTSQDSILTYYDLENELRALRAPSLNLQYIKLVHGLSSPYS